MAEVRFENVTKRFGDTIAIEDLNLTIEDKEFLVLVGPSGCGKSTALRMISGLEEVTEGKIYIGDRVVNDVAPKDRDIAMVFQSYALYPHMTVYNNMAFGLSLRKVPKVDIKRRVEEAARILGIEDLLKRKPRQLSGGQRQRVALGRAIVREPQAFLLDEPLSNLDAKLRVQTRAELSKLHQRLGTTFIYVTHDQTEALTMATRIAVLDKGVLQQVGTPQELYDSPDNLFVAGFIGSPSMNFFEANVGAEDGKLHISFGHLVLPVPPKEAKRLSPHIGKSVTLGIRPENIHDSEFQPAAGRSEEARLAANARVIVDFTELLGNEALLHLKVGDDLFLARVDPRTKAKPGSEIEVVFDMTQMHAFDIVTGEAIV